MLGSLLCDDRSEPDQAIMHRKAADTRTESVKGVVAFVDWGVVALMLNLLFLVTEFWSTFGASLFIGVAGANITSGWE